MIVHQLIVPGVGGVEPREPADRELRRLSTFDADDVPALLYISFMQLLN